MGDVFTFGGCAEAELSCLVKPTVWAFTYKCIYLCKTYQWYECDTWTNQPTKGETTADRIVRALCITVEGVGVFAQKTLEAPGQEVDNSQLANTNRSTSGLKLLDSLRRGVELHFWIEVPLAVVCLPGSKILGY